MDASDISTEALLSSFSAHKDSFARDSTASSHSRMFKPLSRWGHCRLPEGWRFGATIGATLSLCVLIGNIIVLITASASRGDLVSTFQTVREGNCSHIEHMAVGIHLIINAVSTLLLGASNYCMQCLSAPTRAEVNKAHEEGRYLDIGVSSLRNLRAIKRGRLACWLLLGLSSLPLHLM